MPDCQLGCKSMKWTQVLTMTEKEQKVQISAGNRGFPEKINSLSILTTITKLFCKWVTFAWECNFNNPLNSIKTASPGPLPKWPKWPMCYEMKDDQNSIWRWIAQAVPGISWVWVGRGTPAKFKPSFQAARLRTSVKKLSNFLFWNLLSDWCSCGWECLQRGRTACQPQSVCCVEKERKRWQILRCTWKGGTGSPPVTSPLWLQYWNSCHPQTETKNNPSGTKEPKGRSEKSPTSWMTKCSPIPRCLAPRVWGIQGILILWRKKINRLSKGHLPLFHPCQRPEVAAAVLHQGLHQNQLEVLETQVLGPPLNRLKHLQTQHREGVSNMLFLKAPSCWWSLKATKKRKWAGWNTSLAPAP